MMRSQAHMFHQSRMVCLDYPESSLQIRQATRADAFHIADMGKRLLPMAHAEALPEKDLNFYIDQSFVPAQIAREIADSRAQFWLAEQEGRIGGMVKLKPDPLPTQNLGDNPVELSRLYLERIWIGRGVGSRMMRHALKQAAKAEHDICWLTVWSGNARAIRFYRRWGFCIVDGLAYPVGDSRLPALIMARSLHTLRAFRN